MFDRNTCNLLYSLQTNDLYQIELLMLDSNNWNHLICIETIAILVCKQICSYSFKNEITYKLFTYKSYMHIHLNMCKWMTDVWLLLLYSNTWNYFTVCKQIFNSELNYFCWIEVLETI